MNKVNLLVSKITTQGTSVGTTAEGMIGTPAKSGSLLINVVLFFWLVIVVYLWKFYYVEGLKAELADKQKQEATLQGKLDKLKVSAEQAKKDREVIENLKRRRDVIQKLFKARLDALKSLDYLQTTIPERVWLRRLDYLTGKVTFEGSAVSVQDVNIFMRKLEEGGVFVDVNPVRVEEIGGGKGTSFTIHCRLENI